MACGATLIAGSVIFGLVAFDTGSYYCGSPLVPRGEVLVCEKARGERWLVMLLLAGFGVAIAALAALQSRRSGSTAPTGGVSHKDPAGS